MCIIFYIQKVRLFLGHTVYILKENFHGLWCHFYLINLVWYYSFFFISNTVQYYTLQRSSTTPDIYIFLKLFRAVYSTYAICTDFIISLKDLKTEKKCMRFFRWMQFWKRSSIGIFRNIILKLISSFVNYIYKIINPTFLSEIIHFLI